MGAIKKESGPITDISCLYCSSRFACQLLRLPACLPVCLFEVLAGRLDCRQGNSSSGENSNTKLVSMMLSAPVRPAAQQLAVQVSLIGIHHRVLRGPSDAKQSKLAGKYEDISLAGNRIPAKLYLYLAALTGRIELQQPHTGGPRGGGRSFGASQSGQVHR